MEGPTKKTKTEVINDLMSQPLEIREMIFLELPSIRDLLALGMIRKDWMQWLVNSNILLRWERRHLGENDLRREFVFREIFLHQVTFERTYLAITILQNSQVDVFKRLLPRWLAESVPELGHSVTYYLEDTYENRVGLFQFYYAITPMALYREPSAPLHPVKTMLRHSIYFYRDTVLANESKRDLTILSDKNEVVSYMNDNRDIEIFDRNANGVDELVEKVFKMIIEKKYHLMDETRGDYPMRPCIQCGDPESTFTCGSCREPAYCGKSCQKIHWENSHSEACSYS